MQIALHCIFYLSFFFKMYVVSGYARIDFVTAAQRILIYWSGHESYINVLL